MWQGIRDICRDHRHFTACQKQHRQNEPANQVDAPTGVEIHVTGFPKTCRDQRCLTTCQNQHRQNEPDGQVDVPTRVEVWVMFHCLSKKTQTEWTSWSGRCSYQSGVSCDGVSRSLVRTTDISPSVKNNTDRMNQLDWVEVPTGVDVCVTADPRHM